MVLMRLRLTYHTQKFNDVLQDTVPSLMMSIGGPVSASQPPDRLSTWSTWVCVNWAGGKVEFVAQALGRCDPCGVPVRESYAKTKDGQFNNSHRAIRRWRGARAGGTVCHSCCHLESIPPGGHLGGGEGAKVDQKATYVSERQGG